MKADSHSQSIPKAIFKSLVYGNMSASVLGAYRPILRCQAVPFEGKKHEELDHGCEHFIDLRVQIPFVEARLMNEEIPGASEMKELSRKPSV